MKNIKFQLMLALVCVVLGLVMTVQFRTVKAGIGPVSESRARELASQLKNVKEERDSLLKTKDEYEKRIRDYENAASNSSTTAKLLKDELDNARILAGLEDVSGPGIVVYLDDLKFGEKINYPLIEYPMLLQLLNELNAAGAEAVSINDQRVIATTEIRQAGIFINVNTIKFAPPFTFRAIGDPKTLEAALRLKEGIVDSILNSGVAVTITQDQNVYIPKYNGVIDRQYAKVVDKGANQ